MDDMSEPGQLGVDVNHNYVPSGDANAPYPGGLAARHQYRLTPEFYYGLTNNLELGLYLPMINDKPKQHLKYNSLTIIN